MVYIVFPNTDYVLLTILVMEKVPKGDANTVRWM